MTNETIHTKYEINPGEWVDIEAAFDRHTALTARRDLFELELHPDVIRERVASAKTGEVKNVYTPIGFTLKVSGANLSALIKILNAAPVNGDPLNAIVNLEIDSTASDRARENIARYLAQKKATPTLEHIAAGYVYTVDSLNALHVDAAGGEYVVSRITALTGTFKQENITTPTIRETRFIVSAHGGALMFCAEDMEPNEFVGEEYGGYRIVKTFDPGGFALYGGVIMERIKDGE